MLINSGPHTEIPLLLTFNRRLKLFLQPMRVPENGLHRFYLAVRAASAKGLKTIRRARGFSGYSQPTKLSALTVG